MTAIQWTQKRTPQELPLLGGSCLFYGGLGRLGCVLRLCIISVQPLAQVVADYTGHNGDEKGDDILHGPTSFPLERVAALRIVPKFDRKSNTRNMGFSGSTRVKVIVTQNIPTVTELLRRENTSMAVLYMRKSTAILVFFDSAATGRCSTLISDVNDSPAGEADC